MCSYCQEGSHCPDTKTRHKDKSYGDGDRGLKRLSCVSLLYLYHTMIVYLIPVTSGFLHTICHLLCTVSKIPQRIRQRRLLIGSMHMTWCMRQATCTVYMCNACICSIKSLHVEKVAPSFHSPLLFMQLGISLHVSGPGYRVYIFTQVHMGSMLSVIKTE